MGGDRVGELFAMRADGQIGIRDDRNRRGTGGDQRLGGGDLLGELRQRVRVCVTLILQAASQAGRVAKGHTVEARAQLSTGQFGHSSKDRRSGSFAHVTGFLSGTAFADRTVVLIGGGTGIGLSVARLVTAAGGDVVLGGRTPATLAVAAEELGGKARWHLVDTAHQASIDAFFDQIEVLHGLFTTAATYVTGSIAALSVEQAATPFESKFWGQYRVVKSALPKLSSDASVVLMSGAASVRPAGSAPAYVAANAAIEGLARGLAHELAPIRVNALSPGTVDGHLWNQRPPEIRRQAFEHIAAAATLRRPVTEGEVAQAAVYLLLNSATTGSTLYTDGGYALR